MKNYISGARKVLIDYCVVMIFDLVFMAAFIRWIMPYSIVIVIFLSIIIYSDMKRVGIREKKPTSVASSFPLKGLLLGFIGFSPIIVIELVFLAIALSGNNLSDLQHILLNTSMAPLYSIFKALHEMPVGYALASFVVPVVSMIGYLAGYHGFRVKPISKTPRQEF